MALIELNHVVADGMVTYPGLEPPRVCDYWTREASAAHYEAGTSFHIARLDMVANTGTYIDAPFHRYADGPDVSQLSLDAVAELPGTCIAAPAGLETIGPDLFRGRRLEGHAVLIHTGWDRHFGTPDYAEGHPHLSEAAAIHLKDAGAVLVGIDSLNIDDTAGPARPVHSILLAAGIPIVEHMTNLSALPTDGFVFSAAPVRFQGFGSFPVRAFARVP